jgi:hypothetical protein
MKRAYIISRGMEEFASAREQFALIVDRLQSARQTLVQTLA